MLLVLYAVAVATGIVAVDPDFFSRKDPCTSVDPPSHYSSSLYLGTYDGSLSNKWEGTEGE